MPDCVKIDVQLCDILTGPVCSELVIEFIKYVAYQRQQIPYNYQRLRTVLQSKSKLDSKENVAKPSSLRAMRVEQEYLKINEQFQSMESTFKHLDEEINSDNGVIEEVVIVLGATPFSPRDVYRLHLPPVHLGHLTKNHHPQKALLNLYQSLLSSEELHSMMRQPLNPTNIYVMLKKQGSISSDGFLHKQRYTVPVNGRQVVISLKSKLPVTAAVSHLSCTCLGIPVYQDNVSVVHVEEEPMEVSDSSSWYQARTIMKGFKDVKIDGVSVSNFW